MRTIGLVIVLTMFATLMIAAIRRSNFYLREQEQTIEALEEILKSMEEE